MKKWTLQSAKKHYLENTPKCINCKFVDDEGTLRCLVKEDYCINLGGALNCEYFTLKDELLSNEERSNEDFDGGYVDFEGDIAP